MSSVSSSPFSNPNPAAMHHPVQDNRPTNAGDFNQFIGMPGRHPGSIPNITCDASYPPGNSVRPTGSGSATLPQYPVGNNPAGMRQIHVTHMTSNPNQSNTFTKQPSQTIEIQITPRNPLLDSQRPSQYNPHYYRSQTSYPGWNKTVTGSQNETNSARFNNAHGYQSLQDGNRQYMVTRRPAPPVPTTQNQSDGLGNAPMSLQFSAPNNQHIPSPTNPKPAVTQQQHSSRATFYIRNSPSCGQLSDGSRDRTPISLSSELNYNLHESHSEPYLSGQSNYPPTTAAHIPTHPLGANSSPQMNVNSHQPIPDFATPLVVRMDPSDNSNAINSSTYNPYLPATDSGQAGNVNSRYLNMHFGENAEVNNFSGVVNPPSYIYPASNFGYSGASHNDSEQMFINHPPVPNNRCSVPGHPPLFVRTSSSDSDRRSNPGSGDERHVSTHVVYPNVSSDASSVSSESSKRLSSGSMQEEAAYTTGAC